jgi:hypothetical protein
MGGGTGTGGGSGGAAATGGAKGGSSGGGRSGSGGSAGGSGAGSGGQGGASSPAAELEGAGWTMLCGPLSGKGDNQCYLYPPGQSSCPSGGYMSVDKTLHFGGTPGTTYDVTIRFQGTHEAGDYSGGTKVDSGGKMLKGATHSAGGPHTWLAMEVSAPAATYNPNSGGGAGSVQVYDYMATIQIQGGATIHLTGHDQDCLMHRYCQNNVLNPCKGLVVDGISPADDPIDGSFLNMHVMSAVAK